MKRIILLAFASLSGVSIAQNVTFNDQNFKNRVVNHSPTIDLNGDGEIQLSEAQAFSGDIICNFASISDLTGIEEFTSLNGLFCYGNSLTSLDLSNNTSLTKLNCKQNYGLSSLDIANGNNTNITFFRATETMLTCVNVDDASYSMDNWNSDGFGFEFDSDLYFSENCNPSSASLLNLNKTDVSLFPNPTNEILNIQTESNIDNIQIIDFTGKIILKESSNKINVSELEKGVYFVKVSTENGRATQQFVKL